MGESEFYKSLSKVTGESGGRLRQMGFQHVETWRQAREKAFLNGMKYSRRCDPPQTGKAGDK